MQRFGDMAITRKLLLIAALTNVLALLIAAAAYIVFELATSRREMVRVLTVLADEIGLHGAASLSFRDEASARETLAGLKADPNVMAGTLFDKTGAVFATYRRDASVPLLAAPPAQEAEFRANSVLLTRPVMLSGKRIGAVCVESDLELLRRRLLLLGGIVAAAIVVALGLTMGFTLIMQRSVSRPINALASTARRISERKDYSVRAELSTRHDEIGQLAAAFNQMLESIQEREVAQRLNAQRLEALVTLNQMTDATPPQLTDFALEECVRLTRSATGYLAFVNAAGAVTALHLWPAQADDKPDPARAGVWSAVLRQRRPEIVNVAPPAAVDAPPYPASGAHLRRHMNIPLFDGELIVAVAGAGDKDIPYDESDVQQATLLLQSMWRLTQRRQAEEALKRSETLLHEMGVMARVGGWEVNVATGEQQWTDEVYRIHEVDASTYTPTAETGIQFYAPTARPIIQRAFQRAIDYGEPYDLELEFITAKGNKRWVHTSGKAHQASGRTNTVAGTFQDITARKQAEEELWKYRLHLEELVEQRTAELQKTNAQLAREVEERKRAAAALERTGAELQRSNTELEQFAYVASHDLQEPLRKVASFTQLLAERYADGLDAEARQFIAYAVDGAHRMQGLINDLLAYSRVGSRGRAFAPVDGEAVLAQAMANLELAITQSGGAVTHDPLPTVMGDELQLVQLFQNLVGNAIKFHGAEAPWVHVSAAKHEKEWIFQVRDNGIGIDPQYFDQLFVIFQRLHSRTQYPGSGIGLAISKKVVERHGGRIWVESRPGKGSTFCFSIPER